MYKRQDFTWESSDEKVATVDESGNVTGVSEGTAIITATTHNGLKTSSTINVTIPVGKIELSLVDAEKAEVGIGETLRVQAVAYDAEGSTENVAQVFSWRISNSNARITDNGDGTATVTGVRGGTVKIAAVATDGSEVNGQMELTVFVPVTSFYIIPSTANVNVGRTLALKVNGTPGNATYHALTDFTWESSDEKIATVDERGVVTGVSEGRAVITATSHNGIEETCVVNVSIRTNAIDITEMCIRDSRRTARGRPHRFHDADPQPRGAGQGLRPAGRAARGRDLGAGQRRRQNDAPSAGRQDDADV